MTITCSKCETVFTSTSAPCPDNIKGCCVAHFDTKSFICPCGHNMGPEIGATIKEGRVEYAEGIAIINVASIEKLELSEDKG